MKSIYILLLYLSTSAYGQADLTDLEQVQSYLNSTWAPDEDTKRDEEFKFVFTEDFKGKFYGVNIPFNALEFEIVLDKNTAHILWYNSTGRCVSSRIIALGHYLEFELNGKILRFEDSPAFIGIGCPSF